MKALFRVPIQIVILALGFSVIFLGFNGVQQYVIPFFAEKGMVEMGFQSLILIYLFFIAANPLATAIVVKYGPKIAIAGASLAYSLYIFSLASGFSPFIYFASILLGVGAAFIWVGQNSYILRISKEDSRGKNIGFFDMFFFLGSALGVLGVGFVSSQLSFHNAFLLFAITPLVGFFILLRLPGVQIEEKSNQFVLLKKVAKSDTVRRIAGAWLIVFFVLGLAIGILPIQIKATLGITYVGILTSLFFIFPIFLMYGLGTISDRVGRKKMLVLTYVLVFVGLFVLLFSKITTLLIVGIIVLALAWTTARISLLPLTGDVSTKENLESLIAFFWMAQNAGVVLALLLGRFLTGQIELLYIIVLALTVFSFIAVFPLLRRSITDIQKRIANEVL